MKKSLYAIQYAGANHWIGDKYLWDWGTLTLFVSAFCPGRWSRLKSFFLPVTILITPWCRVLLEQLTGLKLVKKFPAFHGTRRSSIALTSVYLLSLSWASPIQSIYPHPTSWRSIPILSTQLRPGLPSGLHSSGFFTKTLYTPSPRPHAKVNILRCTASKTSKLLITSSFNDSILTEVIVLRRRRLYYDEYWK